MPAKCNQFCSNGAVEGENFAAFFKAKANWSSFVTRQWYLHFLLSVCFNQLQRAFKNCSVRKNLPFTTENVTNSILQLKANIKKDETNQIYGFICQPFNQSESSTIRI